MLVPSNPYDFWGTLLAVLLFIWFVLEFALV
jgi:hypothetical protein